ncbi:beta-N-acetylhexosaminidase [Pradoshia eiseniae]|uniref:beta-N-acetylhexosaminidase n=1 Tax=Pradoshia eiseniae TaxID=2064768 RepID=A0A2S7N5D2_9BACI|nr:glycoside hydrolase family 3 protein [Pradoshia eiseniae]PQD97238.1 beta-N-acetylhexosaminidase [Pradoshia eiseniae]
MDLNEEKIKWGGLILRKRKWFLLLLAISVIVTAGFSSPSKKKPPKPQDDVRDVVIYQNLPEADKTISGKTVQMEAIKVYKDGHFTKTDDVKWSAANKKVARISSDGELTLTGKSGIAPILSISGKKIDTAFLVVDKRGKASFRTMKHKRYKIADYAISKMSVEEKLGQMLMPDYRNWNGQNVTEMLPEIEQQIKDFDLGGVILFRENVVTTEQTARLVDAYQQASEKYGMFVSIDQEGGIVTRLQSGTDMPGNMALGATRSAEITKDVARAIGEELASLGINTNFAPTLDVNNNPDNPVIGVRSFSENPELTAELGTAYIEGMQGAGTIATAKHFPGHGDTAVDSHVGLPEVPYEMDRLREVELYPFQQAMNAGVDAIMSAHITFPKIDETKVISKKTGEEISLPATLSHRILTGLIREEMNYDGLIVTDAMNMGAITEHYGTVDAAIMSVKAGTDIVLMPVGLEASRAGLLEAIASGEIKEKRIDASVKRILSLKIKRGIFKEESPEPLEERIAKAVQTVGSPEHKAIEKTAAEKSITLVKNDDVLPLSGLEDSAKLVVIGATYNQDLFNAIKSKHTNTSVINLPADYQLTEPQKEQLREADYIIIGSHTSNVAQRLPSHPQMQRINDLIANYEAPAIAVAIRNPYDIMSYPEVDAYIAQYGFRTASFNATAAAIFGEINPSGKLPVTIPAGQGEILYPFGHGLSY